MSAANGAIRNAPQAFPKARTPNSATSSACISPSEDDKADKTLLWVLKEVLGQQNLVLMGGFNYPDICWGKRKKMAHKLSMKFLECYEICHLLQVLDVQTRSSTLIDLLVSN